MEKTNVMRILEQKKIKYNEYFYGDTDAIAGLSLGRVFFPNDQPIKEWIRFGICVFSAVTVMYKAKI